MSQMPWINGDGYSWGGEAIVTIGECAIMVGAGKEAETLAREIARRWNAARIDAALKGDGDEKAKF